jgi:hypothetical protein
MCQEYRLRQLPVFVGKDDGLKKDSVQGNSRGSGIFLGNVITLFATISAATGFDFT